MHNKLGPRILTAETDIEMSEMELEDSQDEIILGSVLEDILDLFRCPICLDIFEMPVKVKECGHQFCRECAEKYGRLFKPAHCALCRNQIMTRRDLRIDMQLISLINKFIPDVRAYKTNMCNYLQSRSSQQLFEEVSRQDKLKIAEMIMAQKTQNNNVQADQSSLKNLNNQMAKDSQSAKVSKLKVKQTKLAKIKALQLQKQSNKKVMQAKKSCILQKRKQDVLFFQQMMDKKKILKQYHSTQQITNEGQSFSHSLSDLIVLETQPESFPVQPQALEMTKKSRDSPKETCSYNLTQSQAMVIEQVEESVVEIRESQLGFTQQDNDELHNQDQTQMQSLAQNFDQEDSQKSLFLDDDQSDNNNEFFNQALYSRKENQEKTISLNKCYQIQEPNQLLPQPKLSYSFYISAHPLMIINFPKHNSSFLRSLRNSLQVQKKLVYCERNLKIKDLFEISLRLNQIQDHESREIKGFQVYMARESNIEGFNHPLKEIIDMETTIDHIDNTIWSKYNEQYIRFENPYGRLLFYQYNF
eukprot:403368698